jgi:hypothetical protein
MISRKAPMEHQHRELRVNNIAFDSKELVPFSHNLSELSRAFTACLDHLSQAPLKGVTLNAYLQLLHSNSFKEKITQLNPLCEATIMTFRLLDDLVFGGVLKSYCIFHLHPPKPFGLQNKEACCQVDSPAGLKRTTGYRICYICRIAVYHIPEPNLDSSTSIKYVSSLLHEMAHAYFEIYACNCLDCFPTKEEAGGHFTEWHEVGQAIEAFQILKYCYPTNRSRA